MNFARWFSTGQGWAFALIFLLCIASDIHAQAACPPGTVPYGSGSGQEMCGPDESQSETPQQNLPPTPLWKDEWMALAADPARSVLGVATYKSTAEEAKRAAMADCKAKGGVDCKIENAIRNGCAAFVTGSKGYNLNGGSTIDEAIDKGMAVCQSESSNCKIYYSGCSLPVRIR